MTIKNVVRTNNAVLSVASGSVSTLTLTLSADLNVIYYKGASRCTAWFEGRLWTFSAPGPSNLMRFLRWNSAGDTWANQPDFTNDVNHQLQAGSGGSLAVPGLIAFRDNIYLVWDITNLTTGLQTWGYMRWNPNPATNGSTTIEAKDAGTGAYTATYSNSGQGHIIDIIEYAGNIYFTTSMNLLSILPPSGDVVKLEEEASLSWVNQAPRSLGTFKGGSSAISQLFMIDATGKVKVVTGTVLQTADLTSVNPAIYNSGLGFRPAIVQVGSQLFAFVNSSTGVLLFSSSDGFTWTDITSILPPAWKIAKAHIKYTVDPSTPEVRIMFVGNSGAFDAYTFSGSVFTYLGSGTPTQDNSYTFFDQAAPKVEIESTPVVDSVNKKATFAYQIFNEAGISGTVTLTAEYSIDLGATWHTATRKGVEGDGLTGLSALDSRPAGAGSPYTFVWDWFTDLGSGLYPNVRFRIRGI